MILSVIIPFVCLEPKRGFMEEEVRTERARRRKKTSVAETNNPIHNIGSYQTSTEHREADGIITRKSSSVLVDNNTLLKIKSQTSVEYNHSDGISIKDSIVFSKSSSESKEQSELSSPLSSSLQAKGRAVSPPQEVVYSEKIDCQKLIELLKTPSVLLIYAQGTNTNTNTITNTNTNANTNTNTITNANTNNNIGFPGYHHLSSSLSNILSSSNIIITYHHQ